MHMCNMDVCCQVYALSVHAGTTEPCVHSTARGTGPAMPWGVWHCIQTWGGEAQPAACVCVRVCMCHRYRCVCVHVCVHVPVTPPCVAQLSPTVCVDVTLRVTPVLPPDGFSQALSWAIILGLILGLIMGLILGLQLGPTAGTQLGWGLSQGPWPQTCSCPMPLSWAAAALHCCTWCCPRLCGGSVWGMLGYVSSPASVKPRGAWLSLSLQSETPSPIQPGNAASPSDRHGLGQHSCTIHQLTQSTSQDRDP